MAIKKADLDSSLRASCDELRGGLDGKVAGHLQRMGFKP